MNWKQLISNKRFGLELLHEAKKDDRTEFQRDYDRLIFPPPSGVCKTRHKYFRFPAVSLCITGSHIV